MNFRVVLLAGVSVLGFVGVNSAQAADASPPPPPEYVEVIDGNSTCFYSRFDIGASLRDTSQSQGVEELGFVEAGVGCHITDHLRLEGTVGYRMKSSLVGVAGDLQTFTSFANVFWDITKYNGFTPYFGAGIGAGHHRFSSGASGSHTDFAYNFTAGMGYDLTDSLTLDASYRINIFSFERANGSGTITNNDLRAHELKVGLRYKFGAW